MNRHLAAATDCITLAALDATIERDSAAFGHCRDALKALDALRVEMAALERAAAGLLADRYLADPINADRMAPLRAALAAITQPGA